MGDAIGATLGYAVGIAISPIPIAAVILMLFSGRARVNGLVFLVAWIVGIAGVATADLLIPGLETDDSAAPSDTTGWFKLVLGLLLLAGGVRQWKGRPGPDEEPPTPAWMSRIDELKPPAAFGLGLLLSAVNPKNLLLAAAAGASLGALSLTTGQTVAGVAVFTAIAAVTVAIPVLAFLVAGSRLDPVLDTAKAWLIGNNSAVMAVLFVVFGANLLGDAIRILT